MLIYHTHHITPKHAGGTDDPSNLVRLTVEEHAEAHKKLWEQNSQQEDYIAWRALSGQITMSEASKEAWKMGSIKGGLAKKPNSVPAYNKANFHCIGCRKEIKPSATGHIKCVQKFYKIPPKNNNKFTSSFGSKMATQNNRIAECPHCGKSGQYRAMTRWHFNNCLRH